MDILLQTGRFFRNTIDRWTSQRYWLELTCILLPVSVIFFAFPVLVPFFSTEPLDQWVYVLIQAENPFVHHSYPPDSHQAKLAFRIVPPLLIGAFRSGVVGTYALQILMGIGLFYFAGKTVLRDISDKRQAFIVLVGISFIYAGRVSFTETRAVFDGMALFFIILSIFSFSSIVVFFGVLAASLTDERALICSGLVLLYWLVKEQRSNGIVISARPAAVVVAWLTYFAIRWHLSNQHGLTTYGDQLGIQYYLHWFKSQINNFPLGLWTGLEGFWLLLFLSLVVMFSKKEFSTGLALSGAVVMIVIVSMSVRDITRSMAYLFPAIFVSLLVLERNLERFQLQKVIYAAVGISFLFPAYYFERADHSIWQLPVVIKLIQLIF